jgi:hypothetical protein
LPYRQSTSWTRFGYSSSKPKQGDTLLISIQSQLIYSVQNPCSHLLQIEAAEDERQTRESTSLVILPDVVWPQIKGEENIGIRRWGRDEGDFDCTYSAQVHVDRPAIEIATLNKSPLTSISNDVTKFLMPSRYCHSEDFLDFVPKQFGRLTGGALIKALADWIKDNFTYDNGASNGSTTATDSFTACAGVCRATHIR